MFVMHNEEAIFTAQTEKNSTIFKKTAVRGNIQQTIKQQNGNFINLIIISNEKSKSFLATSDLGTQIKNVSSVLMEGINATLWEVIDEGDKRPTYILQWEYKNVYYELSGKVLDSEMEEIAKNIMY